MSQAIQATPLVTPAVPSMEFTRVDFPLLRATYPDPNGPLSLVYTVARSRDTGGGVHERAPVPDLRVLIDDVFTYITSEAQAGRPEMAMAMQGLLAALKLDAARRGLIAL